jgi:hypothetical protein
LKRYGQRFDGTWQRGNWLGVGSHVQISTEKALIEVAVALVDVPGSRPTQMESVSATEINTISVQLRASILVWPQDGPDSLTWNLASAK